MSMWKLVGCIVACMVLLGCAATSQPPSYMAYRNYGGYDVVAYHSEIPVASIDLTVDNTYIFPIPPVPKGDWSVALRTNEGPFDLLNIGPVDWGEPPMPKVHFTLCTDDGKQVLNAQYPLLSLHYVTFSTDPTVYYLIGAGNCRQDKHLEATHTVMPDGIAVKEGQHIPRDKSGHCYPTELNHFAGWGTFFSIPSDHSPAMSLKVTVNDPRVRKPHMPANLVLLKLGK